jgi:hypothetical protein
MHLAPQHVRVRDRGLNRPYILHPTPWRRSIMHIRHMYHAYIRRFFVQQNLMYDPPCMAASLHHAVRQMYPPWQYTVLYMKQMHPPWRPLWSPLYMRYVYMLYIHAADGRCTHHGGLYIHAADVPTMAACIYMRQMYPPWRPVYTCGGCMYTHHGVCRGGRAACRDISALLAYSCAEERLAGPIEPFSVRIVVTHLHKACACLHRALLCYSAQTRQERPTPVQCATLPSVS